MLAALDAGADDIVDEGDDVARHVRSGDRRRVRAALEAAGIDGDVGRVDDDLVDDRAAETAEDAKKVLRVIDASKTTTTCRTSTATSTSPTRSSTRWRPSGGSAAGVGDAAPDFTLPGTGGRSLLAGGLSGASPSCSSSTRATTRPSAPKQLNTYTGDIAQFEEVGAQVLAISPQSVESHEGFAAKHGFAFPLLADTDKDVAGRTARSARSASRVAVVFVVDADGIIRYAHRAIAGLTFRPVDELVRAVEAARLTPVMPRPLGRCGAW